MNYSLFKLYLENPERAREVAHGLELAACAFQAQAIRKGLVSYEATFGGSAEEFCGSKIRARGLAPAMAARPAGRNFGLEVAAANFNAQIRKLEAVSRDKHGHFYKPDGAACPHSDGGGGGKQKKGRHSSAEKSKYGKLANKIIKSADAFERINNPKGETITAADGKPAIFNSQSVKHVVGDHSVKDGRRRMKELFFAQDTTATGISFESLNKGKKQTEFIKEYDTGEGKRYFYTARRGKSNVVYSWHEISSRKFLEKKKGAAK